MNNRSQNMKNEYFKYLLSSYILFRIQKAFKDRYNNCLYTFIYALRLMSLNTYILFITPNKSANYELQSH